MPFMKSLSEEGYIIIIKDTHVKMQAQPKRRQAGEKVKGMSGHKTSIIRKFENYLKIHSSLLTQRRFQHHIHCPVQKTETNLRKIYYHKQRSILGCLPKRRHSLVTYLCTRRSPKRKIILNLHRFSLILLFSQGHSISQWLILDCYDWGCLQWYVSILH